MQAARKPRCWPNRWRNLLTVRWEWFIAGSECINLANHANLFGTQSKIVWLVATSTVCWFFMPFRWFLVHAGFRRAGLCHDAKKVGPSMNRFTGTIHRGFKSFSCCLFWRDPKSLFFSDDTAWNQPGWWFGTWTLWLSIYWECHNPNWRTHIFQRGRYTTNEQQMYPRELSPHWHSSPPMRWCQDDVPAVSAIPPHGNVKSATEFL